MKNKYMIDGMTLKEYCEKKGLNINTQRNRVRQYIVEHPELSQEDAIKLAISKCGTCYIKFSYKGTSLTEYCKKNDINYYTMVSRIEEIIKKNPKITNDEATRIAIEECNDNGIIYYYNNMPLVDYCRLNSKYNYSSILTYIKREKKKFPKKSNQEIVNSYFEKNHKIHTKHYVRNETLKEYCEKKGLNYIKVISYISKIRNDNPELSAKEILNKAIEKVESLVDRKPLMYQGIYLTEYCRQHDLLFSSIYQKIYNLIDRENLNLEDAIEKAIKTFNKFGIKYYVGDMSLVEYCSYYSYNYSLLKNRISRNISENSDKYSAIEEAIEFYDRKKFIKNINNYFNMLDGNITEENLYKIFITLNIDFENFNSLLSRGYDNKAAISLIWYFNDSEFENKLSISNKKLQEILEMSKRLFKISLDYKSILEYDVFDLLGIYKSGLYDTRYLIILHFKYYIVKNINSISNYYNLNLTKEENEDITNEINIQMLNAIEKFNSSNRTEFISYMNKVIKGNIYHEILEIFANSTISFNRPIRENMTLENTLSSPINLESEYSSELLDIINELKESEKKFIYYKYNEEYPNSEIGDMLGLTEIKIDSLEEKIIEKIRNNKKIINMKLKNKEKEDLER